MRRLFLFIHVSVTNVSSLIQATIPLFLPWPLMGSNTLSDDSGT